MNLYIERPDQGAGEQVDQEQEQEEVHNEGHEINKTCFAIDI